MNRSKPVVFRTASLLAVLFVGSQAFAVTDGFESYSLGNIDGQGNWTDFGGTLTPDVSTEQAHTGTQSLKLTANPAEPDGYGSDVFQNIPTQTSGVWNLSYWIYVPDDFRGASILHLAENTIVAGDIDMDFGLQLVVEVADMTQTDPAINRFLGSQDGVNGTMDATIIPNQWVEVTADIDLDNNTVSASYGGTQVFSGAWDPDPTGPSDVPALGGFDAWVQGTDAVGSVYYDNFSLVPEPATNLLCLVGLVSLYGFMRRK